MSNTGGAIILKTAVNAKTPRSKGAARPSSNLDQTGLNAEMQRKAEKRRENGAFGDLCDSLHLCVKSSQPPSKLYSTAEFSLIHPHSAIHRLRAVRLPPQPGASQVNPGASAPPVDITVRDHTIPVVSLREERLRKDGGRSSGRDVS